MTSLFARRSIRTQVVLLALAILAPVLVLMGTLLVTDLRDTREAARRTVRLMADNTASDLRRMLHDNASVLERLAARPLARSLNPGFCGQSLAEFVELNPEYVTLGLRDARAHVVCSLLPNAPPTERVVDSAWFTAGLRSNGFMAGDAMIGPATGRWVSIMTHPVRDAAGSVRGLLALPVDLEKLSAKILGAVPRGATVAVLDRHAAVLLRSADAGAYLGKRGPASTEEATRGQREGFIGSTGLDGVTRLWAFVTIPDAEWRVVAGLPESEVYAPYYAKLRRSLLLHAGITLLALLLAWRIALAVVRPISALAGTAADVASGDPAVRAREDGPPEIVAVARQFNQMLDNRDRDEETLRLSDAALKVISQGVVITDTDLRVVSVNDAFTAITGYGRSDILGQSCAKLQGPLTDPATVSAIGAACRRGESYSGEILNYRRNGEAFWNELGIVALRDAAGAVTHFIGVMRDISERLRAEREQRQILERVGDAFVALDRNWCYTYVNQKAAEMLGRTPTQLIGRHIWTEFPEGVGQKFHLAYERAMAEQQQAHLEEYYPPYDRWFENHIYPSRDGLSIYFHDITARKRIERALRESEERFRRSFEAAGVGMAITALDGRWLQVNQALCDIVGYPEQELLQLTFQDITYGPDLAQDLENMDRMLAGTIRDFQMEKRYLHRDGHAVWIHLSVALVRDAEGAPLHTVAHMQDISRRKALEQALRDSEQRYRRIVQTAEEGIWTIDAQALTTYVNPKMAAMLGYEPSEILGRAMTEFMDEQGQSIARQNLARSRKSSPEQHDFKFRRKDGSVLWSLVVTNPISGDDGGYAGALAMVTDITRRRQVEEALRHSLKDKEALLREVHHRVKNNLQVVHSLLNLEGGRSREPAARAVLRDMQGRVQSMALLHESLYRGHNHEAVDLGAYVREVSAQVLRASAAQRGAIALELDLVSVQVALDQAAPCGLLVNELISNCCKHAFPGDRSGTVRVELHRVGDGHDARLRLRVRDDGVGLPADLEDRRARSLGLQLASDLAHQLGAVLDIGPAPGAVFTVQFAPALPDAAETAA